MPTPLPPLLPEPRHAQRRPGRLLLDDDLPVVLPPGADEADFAAACALREGVAARSGRRLAVETHARSDDLGPRLELQRRGDGGEGYRLEIDERGAVLRASGAPGLRYGVETLLQLVDERAGLPACEIDDAPELALRGLLLDVSRGKVPSVETVKQLLELCVRLKLNALMLYTEHTFQFRRHPEIGAGCSSFRAEEMRELDAFAAARHVDLIPTLQTLGHMERILSLPRYRSLAESERGWSLSPADPGSYALLSDLLDEYLPNFRSGFVNANCDEPWDLGRGRSARRAERAGRGGLFLEHVRRVRDLARAHGKRTMIWGDFLHAHPETLAELDADIVVLDWGYEADEDTSRLRALRDRGLDFLACSGTSSWNALFPRMDDALENVARWAEAAQRFRARGLICTDWGDHGHYNLQGNSWFAFAWTAQQAWSGAPDPGRFDRAFGRTLFGETRGDTARCYRELGGIHDAGFHTPNASPLQALFFDDLEQAELTRRARPAALRRSLARLERARARVAASTAAFGEDALTPAELLYAADASAFALRKALSGREWLAWRERPGALDAHGRRRLARRLDSLAGEQAALARRLRRLWRARSRASNFEITRRRIDASVRGQRRAARALERNVPPAPLSEPDADAVLDELRRLYALGQPRRRGSST